MDTLTRDQLKIPLDRAEDFVLVNVLAPEVFEERHIPGSHCVPLDDDGFEQRIEDLTGGKGLPVVLYSAGFNCDASFWAAQKLEKAGFTDVYDYEGGTEDWQEAGYTVQSGRAHVCVR